MAISKATLAAIQKTRASAQGLKLALQAETKKYSDRLSKALAANTNGNAFELLDGPDVANWKSVGTLAKMIDAIEAEFAGIFKFASDLVTGSQPSAATSPLVATTKVKSPTAPNAKTKPKAQSKVPVGRGNANAEALLIKLAATLSSDSFTALKQTELAKSTGIPIGSMSAALKKLTRTGDLVQGKDGGYKLSKKKAAPVAKAAVAVTTEATAPKTVARKSAEKAAPVAKKKASKAGATKTVAVVSQPKQKKPVVTTVKPVGTTAVKKSTAKKPTSTAKPTETAAAATDAENSASAAEVTAVPDTAMVAAS